MGFLPCKALSERKSVKVKLHMGTMCVTLMWEFLTQCKALAKERGFLCCAENVHPHQPGRGVSQNVTSFPVYSFLCFFPGKWVMMWWPACGSTVISSAN
jgi:hypothetical protein